MHLSKEMPKRHKMSPLAIWRAGSAHPHSPWRGEGRSRTQFVPLCQLRCAGMAKTCPSLLAPVGTSGCITQISAGLAPSPTTAMQVRVYTIIKRKPSPVLGHTWGKDGSELGVCMAPRSHWVPAMSCCFCQFLSAKNQRCPG